MKSTEFETAKIVGFYSLPSASLAEHNTSAYNAALADAPDGAGSCAYCGTSIVHHVIVKLATGVICAIGTDCAERIGQETSNDELRSVRNRETTEQRDRRLEENERRDAEWRTAREEQIARVDSLRAVRYEALKEIIDALEAQQTEFHSSLASQLRDRDLSDRQASYATKAIVGRETKKNSDEWWRVYGLCVNLEANSNN